MTLRNSKKWVRHRKTLGVAVVAALTLHFLGIYSLKDLPIEFDGFSSEGLASFLQNPHPGERSDVEQKEQREEDLAAILNQMQQRSEAEESEDPFDFAGLGTDISHDGDDLYGDLESLVEDREEEFLSVDEELDAQALDAFSEKDLMDDLDNLNAADLAFESDLELVDDMLKATDVVPGMEDMMAIADSLEGMEVSLFEGEDASGLADQQQSGDLNADKSLHDTVTAEAESGRRNEETGGTAHRKNARASRRGSTLGTSRKGSIASSVDFDLAVEVAAAENGDGYVFELRFVPKKDAQFRRIKQNMFFVLDRSHSIPKNRYESSKYAVIQSLEHLRPGDTFNILVFDKKVVRFSEQPVAWTLDNVAKAKEFIRSQPYGGFFASTDLYTSLHKIVPEAVSDYEVNTAILMTDGDTYLSQEDQRKSISKWTESNQGKVSLFTTAAGEGNHLPLLDLLSRYNRGSLTYSDEESGFENALVGLVKSINRPIGKDIVAHVVTGDSDQKVTLYPREGRMPDLYEGVPYTLYGRVSKLADFHVFIQGKYYGRWLDIKRTVSFETAQGVNRRIERQVALAEAYDEYDRYFKEGKKRHLAEARRILTPFRIPVAFR